MKKRLLIITLALVLIVCCFAAVACDMLGQKNPDDTGNQGTQETQVTQYTVTFKSDDEVIKTVLVNSDSCVASQDVPAPTKQYFNFSGWRKEGSKKNTDVTTYVVTADVTFVAQWTVDPSHEHDYQQSSTAAPTCTECGKIIYTCSICKAEKSEDNLEQPALDHNYQLTSTKDPTCTDYGKNIYTCERCQTKKTENDLTKPALGHTLDFAGFDGNDYFSIVQCSVCGNYAHRESLHTYDDVFKVTFDEAKQTEIEEFYAAILQHLDDAEAYDETKHKNEPNGQGVYDHENPYYIANKEGFEQTYYDPFYEYIDYVIEQYQYAYVFYCVYEGDDEWEARYNTLSDFRTDCVKDFYALYRKIYNTQFREFFFSKEEGWTDEDIEKALIMSDSYGGDEYAELNKRADEILIEFRDIANQDTDSKVLDLYEEFVGINRQIAKLSDYDDYMEYAYTNVYDREYSPADVAQMRAYVKQYIKPLFTKLLNGYRAKYPNADTDMTKALLDKSIFSHVATNELVQAYLKDMVDTTVGSKSIDYWSEANDIFKHGNSYTGKHSGAFSYYIGAQDATILFFGPNSYSGAFTFVHEFGHYFNNIYNPGLSLSMDHDETQSQGDEMLFLAWLHDYLQTVVDSDKFEDTYNKVVYDQLFNIVATICMATAVDEFEQAVYSNTYGEEGSRYYDGITKSQYDTLFSTIMKDYGIGTALNNSYWRYVVIEAPAYYISYAMSALPSVEIYVKAMTDGFEAARTSYFKLYTFSDNSQYVRIDGDNDKVVDATYEQILNYAGLYGPFQEDLYKKLAGYFQ